MQNRRAFSVLATAATALLLAGGPATPAQAFDSPSVVSYGVSHCVNGRAVLDMTFTNATSAADTYAAVVLGTGVVPTPGDPWDFRVTFSAGIVEATILPGSRTLTVLVPEGPFFAVDRHDQITTHTGAVCAPQGATVGSVLVPNPAASGSLSVQADGASAHWLHLQDSSVGSDPATWRRVELTSGSLYLDKVLLSGLGGVAAVTAPVRIEPRCGERLPLTVSEYAVDGGELLRRLDLTIVGEPCSTPTTTPTATSPTPTTPPSPTATSSSGVPSPSTSPSPTTTASATAVPTPVVTPSTSPRLSPTATPGRGVDAHTSGDGGSLPLAGLALGALVLAGAALLRRR